MKGKLVLTKERVLEIERIRWKLRRQVGNMITSGRLPRAFAIVQGPLRNRIKWMGEVGFSGLDKFIATGREDGRDL